MARPGPLLSLCSYTVCGLRKHPRTVSKSCYPLATTPFIKPVFAGGQCVWLAASPFPSAMKIGHYDLTLQFACQKLFHGPGRWRCAAITAGSPPEQRYLNADGAFSAGLLCHLEPTGETARIKSENCRSFELLRPAPSARDASRTQRCLPTQVGGVDAPIGRSYCTRMFWRARSTAAEAGRSPVLREETLSRVWHLPSGVRPSRRSVLAGGHCPPLVAACVRPSIHSHTPLCHRPGQRVMAHFPRIRIGLAGAGNARKTRILP
jgi:hypothetical protein